MKPSQPSGPVQSRVWYAHTLVVPEKRESKVNESAVAAAARLALESAPQVSHSLQRRRRPRRFLEAGLLATSAVLLFLVWRQYAADPSSSSDTAALANADIQKDVDVPVADAERLEQVPAAVADKMTFPPATETVPALAEAAHAEQPRVAGFTATNEDYSADEGEDLTAALPASEYAVAPDRSGDSVGELESSPSGSEISVIEVDESDAQPAGGDTEPDGDTEPRADAPPKAESADTQAKPDMQPAQVRDDAAETVKTRSQSVISNARSKPAPMNKAVNQTKPKKPAAASSKQSTQATTDFGDCAMPSWAWRVFGFTEEKRKRPCS